MAANMQHMAGAGHMMSQQQQQMHMQQARANANQYGQTILARLTNSRVPPQDWHATVPMNDRVGRTLELFSNVTLGSNLEPTRALDMSINFELSAFEKCTSKELYFSYLKNKIAEFFKRRQANGGNLQNGLNASAQAQASLGMQQQMGRGFGPQQGFGGMNQPMQGQQMPNQQQMLQIQQQQQQRQQQMAASMAMANQAGRGTAGPNPQLAMGPSAPAQRSQGIANEINRLLPADRERVNEIALVMFGQAPEHVKQQFRTQIRSKMTPAQNAEYVASGRDPCMIIFQQHAFQYLVKQAAANRAKAAGNMNPQQAAMMQQQNSQQRANNMMPNGAPAAHDFSQFGPSMESIKDQQMSGLIAQQAGQMVVPASGAARNPTPQPGNQGMINQGQNQTPRQGQQPGQQQQQQQQQQIKLNQASQQAQAQAAQMKQMHSQQGGPMDPNQSPAMNPTANRGPNGVNPMGTPGIQHGNMPFGNQLPLAQRFHANPQLQATVLSMAASMNPDQQHHLSQLNDEKVMDLVRRWLAQNRQRATAAQINATQLQQQNQVNQNPAGAVLQGAMQPQQQPNATGPNGGSSQGQGVMNLVTPQMQHVMDSLDLPPPDIVQVRNQRPDLVSATDEQVRVIAMGLKRNNWQMQVANRMRAQASHSLGPLNPMGGPAAAQMGQQHNQTPQQHEANRQQPRPPQPPQQQGGTMPGASVPAQAAVAVKQQSTPQQPAKNLKRPSADDAAGADNVADAGSAGGARPNNSTGPKKLPPQLSAQQIASMTPEQRAKYEVFLRQQVANREGGAAALMQPTAESISRLKTIGQEAARQLMQEPMADIPMSPQELEETGAKLKRIVIDMGKVGRGLTRWFALTGDEPRASMFFKFRQRLIKQFVDGDNMKILRDSFSMRSSDLEQARAMLESMVRDIQVASKGGFMRAQNNQAQGGQAAQQASQGNAEQTSSAAAAVVAPLNASNLEKNSQALNRQKSKSANQPPPAPTVAQAPGFPTNASSPHGNPSYMSKAKDMNLQIPPRKKQKVAQQPGQGVNTPSPRVSKTASPEVKRAPEPVPRPVFLCKEADCDLPSVGFPTEQALKQHVEEDHVKPRQDPVKFVQENLALALGLEMDGTVKKGAGEAAQPMTQSGSKQGQDVAMKRSGSALSRVQPVGGRGENGTPKTTAAEATTPGPVDPWATATIDPQALLSNLGFENGLPTVMNEFLLYRSLTPNDTPESSKDSGASEPNSDISEGAALEIDMNWQNIDTDVLLNMNNTSLDASGSTLDPSLLLDPLAGPPPDWDDMTVDFNKPFQFDTSHYSFDTSS
ncbi:hypothetical protein BM221_004070 [Beauveria bassiana]|uniref:Mediator complex subunit 15 KIX domain-containing protein n=1 Tax=Beauveria bassiana TaxID=176275 RepID=A0A2N6NQ97_BEABA|nr:hypothetical protein BM221_004070 [Beauveria bassiana]